MYSTADLYRHFFQYEQDSHEKVLAALNASDESVRTSEFFRKAVDIMGHVVIARMVWLWRFGVLSARPEAGSFNGLSLTRLEQEMRGMHAAWSGYLAGVDEAELSRTIEYTSFDGQPRQNRVLEILIQVHGHSLYHRGQISTWLKQAGAEPVATDYLLWARDTHG